MQTCHEQNGLRVLSVTPSSFLFGIIIQLWCFMFGTFGTFGFTSFMFVTFGTFGFTLLLKRTVFRDLAGSHLELCSYALQCLQGGAQATKRWLGPRQSWREGRAQGLCLPCFPWSWGADGWCSAARWRRRAAKVPTWNKGALVPWQVDQSSNPMEKLNMTCLIRLARARPCRGDGASQRRCRANGCCLSCLGTSG